MILCYNSFFFKCCVHIVTLNRILLRSVVTSFLFTQLCSASRPSGRESVNKFIVIVIVNLSGPGEWAQLRSYFVGKGSLLLPASNPVASLSAANTIYGLEITARTCNRSAINCTALLH